MSQTTPQPEGSSLSSPGVPGLGQRILQHRATIPMLAGALLVIPGFVLIVMFSGPDKPINSAGLLAGGFLAMSVTACVIVCGVAYILEKRKQSRLLASVDSAQLQYQKSRMSAKADLDGQFRQLRDRLCRGVGRKDAKKWRSKIDAAVSPDTDFKDVLDRWLRWIFTTADGPLQRALLAKGGGPLRKTKLLEPADLGIPLPGERRSSHMTPAWYADQVARAAKKTATPQWRSYIDILFLPVTLGGLFYLYFVAQAPLAVLGFFTILVILISPALYAWSVGINPGEGYAWRAMARRLVVELHASAPHAVQPDCFDTDCPNNPDASVTGRRGWSSA